MIREMDLLIAGDGRRGDNDPVAGLDLHLAMAGEGHAVQGRHILALEPVETMTILFFGRALDLH